MGRPRDCGRCGRIGRRGQPPARSRDRRSSNSSRIQQPPMNALSCMCGWVGTRPAPGRAARHAADRGTVPGRRERPAGGRAAAFNVAFACATVRPRLTFQRGAGTRTSLATLRGIGSSRTADSRAFRGQHGSTAPSGLTASFRSTFGRGQHSTRGSGRAAPQPCLQHWHSCRTRVLEPRTSWALSWLSRFLPSPGMRCRRTTPS